MIKGERFKTINLVVAFVYTPTKKNYCLATLLDDIIASHTDIHNNEKSIAILKQDMYGSRISIASDYYAKMYSAFMISIPSPRLVDDANLFNQAIDVLKEIVFEHHTISEGIFNNRKRMIIEAFLSLKNDKRRFSRVLFADEVFKDTFFPSYVEAIEIIEKTTIEEFSSFYQNVVLKGKCIALNNGPLIDKEIHLFQDSFLNDKIAPASPYASLPIRNSKLSRSKIASGQTEICLSYNTVVTTLEDSMKANLVNIILGGAFESRLFSRIREKLGLCYDISSRYNRNFSLFTVNAGVDPKKEELALLEITNTIDDYIKNGMTLEELLLAKDKAKNSLLSRGEAQMSYINDALENIISGLDNSIENKFKIIDEISLDKINQFIKTLKPFYNHIFSGVRDV